VIVGDGPWPGGPTAPHTTGMPTAVVPDGPYDRGGHTAVVPDGPHSRGAQATEVPTLPSCPRRRDTLCCRSPNARVRARRRVRPATTEPGAAKGRARRCREESTRRTHGNCDDAHKPFPPPATVLGAARAKPCRGPRANRAPGEPGGPKPIASMDAR